MKKLRKALKWIVIVLGCVFVIVQFWRPARTNPPVDQLQTIHAQLQVTPQVAGMLDRSCQDCHSNTTRWPWYSNLAPVSWLVTDDVNHGRKEMNLSEWGSYDRDSQRKLLRDMCEQVEDGAMPLGIYTPLHPGSKPSPEDVKALCDWTNAERARIAAQQATPH